MEADVRPERKGPRGGEPQAQRTWTFDVQGPLMGHKCSKSECFSSSVKAYKTLVRFMGNLAGVPQDLDPKRTYTLRTEVFWVKKPHCDTINVHKLTEDGLWGKDRRVLHGSYSAQEYAGFERAVITVTVEGLTDGRRDSGRGSPRS